MKVTAVAPDTIKLDDPDAPPSLNLFLYRTSRNLGWAEVGLPSFDGNGTRLTNPPLALNLHYLLTAYGSADFQAEILLGYAMHLLHERPVLDRAAIRRALDPSPLGASILPPAFQALTASDLADQVDAVTITRRADGHRGDVAALVGDPGALPADRRVRRLGRADRGAQADAQRAAGALARAGRPGDRQATAASSSSRACCRRTRRSSAIVPPDDAAGGAPRRDGAARRPPPRRHLGGRALRAPAARRRRTRSRSARAPTRPGSTSRSRPAPRPRRTGPPASTRSPSR